MFYETVLLSLKISSKNPNVIWDIDIDHEHFFFQTFKSKLEFKWIPLESMKTHHTTLLVTGI